MAQVCDKPLKDNPFVTLRDPQTGEWRVVRTDGIMSKDDSKPQEGSSHAQ
ncbi:hypothetical protein [Okeania sp. SIO2G5]|nr:hypothetical protein [Okeania sp. SIO2G5]